MVRKTLYELDSANQVLPLVRSIVRDVVEDFHALRNAGREQRALEAEPTVDVGARRRIRALRENVGTASNRIEGYLRELESLGLELRDLETGLVDFPTVFQGEPAYFCWKPGEQDVGYWHAATQGFADRRRLPRAELATISGRALPS